MNYATWKSEIFQELKSEINNFIKSKSDEEKEKYAENISSICAKALKKDEELYKDAELNLLYSLIDFDHFLCEEMPPTTKPEDLPKILEELERILKNIT